MVVIIEALVRVIMVVVGALPVVSVNLLNAVVAVGLRDVAVVSELAVFSVGIVALRMWYVVWRGVAWVVSCGVECCW